MGWFLVAFTVVTISVVALIAAIILRGGVNESAPSVAALISFLGILVTALANVMLTRDVQKKVNGHLAHHIGHSDSEIRAMIDAELADREQHQDQPPRPPVP